MTDHSKTLRQALGDSVRRLRESEGKRQDDLARVARELGLAWPRSKIAALERGEKAISAEELLLLPVLLGWAFERPRSVPWSEILSGPEAIDLTEGARVSAGDVARLFDKKVDAASIVRLSKQPAKRPSVRGALSLSQVFGRLRDLGLKTDTDAFEEIQRQSGETEVRAAQRVGEHYAVYNAISAELWGRSVAAERDARVAAAIPPDASAASTSAHRGRITRDLDEEVRAFIAARVEED